MKRTYIWKENEIVPLLLFITALVSGLIISFLQLLIFLFIYPISKKVYRKINYYLCYSYYAELLFMVEWWAGVELEVYVDKDDYEKYFGKEHGFCLMNHTYEIDWLLGYMFCNHINLLGNCKAYIKKGLRNIPILGWVWYFGDMIIVERSFEKDKENIRKQISEIISYEDPCWILLFPEGTRFTHGKYEEGLIFAKERGLPILKHHLTLRYKGFLTGLKPMRNKIKGLYDITLSFKRDELSEPTIPNLLYGRKMKAYSYIKRIPFEEIPENEEEAIKFLYKIFEIKDRLQESFQQTGDFFAISGEKRETHKILIRKNSLIFINFLFWTLPIVSSLSLYIFYCFVNYKYIQFFNFSWILLILHILLKKLLNYSKRSKGKRDV